MKIADGTMAKWVGILSGPILSLIAFIISYYLDPLNFSGQKELAAIPALLFSVIVLLIGQGINTDLEIRKASMYSGQACEAVKDYLHVIKVGSPEKALQYIIGRMPSLREVDNTSFNTEGELERSAEKYYETDTYNDSCKQIAYYASRQLIWKDIGDNWSVSRFREIDAATKRLSGEKTCHYKYKLIGHKEPQMNFIILEYVDDTREVLFNWDFRGIGKDPTVLLSRDYQIIEMFAIHYAQLWKRASLDHDSLATKSTSMK